MACLCDLVTLPRSLGNAFRRAGIRHYDMGIFQRS